MKFFRKIGLLLLITFQFTQLVNAQNNAVALSFTNNIIKYFSTQQFDSIYNIQDAEMKRKVDANDYETMWNNFIENYDSLASVGETSVTKKDSLWVTVTKISFVKKDYNLKLTINNNNQLAGIFFTNTKINHTPPAYINTLLFYEVKLNVPTKGIESEGVLSIPKGNEKHPIVIIVGGSGPTDKDGTIGANKPYKDLAWALAAKGVAVYRYDKRTANSSNLKGVETDKFTMEQEYLIDLKNIANTLSKDKRFDAKKIVIAGHSQGGFMIPYFKMNLPKVAGFIGLAANYQTIAEIIPNQLAYLSNLNNDSTTKAAYSPLVAKANYTKNHIYDEHANNDSLFPGLTIAFLRHMDKYKPDNIASVLNKKPMLFIQGARDYQVTPAELNLWKNKLKNACCATYIQFEKLNHMLLVGEGKSTPSEYNLPNNVPEYVATEIANWVKKLQ